jgi:hypothetical protein
MQQMPRVRRSIVVTLMAAIVLSIGAQCLAAEDAAEMPCCAEAGHDCHPAITSHDCCQLEQGGPQAPPGHLREAISPLALVPGHPVRDVRPSVFVVRVETTIAPAVSPPKYLLLGSFLI